VTCGNATITTIGTIQLDHLEKFLRLIHVMKVHNKTVMIAKSKNTEKFSHSLDVLYVNFDALVMCIL